VGLLGLLLPPHIPSLLLKPTDFPLGFFLALSKADLPVGYFGSTPWVMRLSAN